MTTTPMSNLESGPLSGYRIVEFAANMTAPLGAMWLADQGADVIKVESPAGDQMRYAGATRKGMKTMSSVFASLNRNKRSIRLDIKQPGARAAFLSLVKDADVVLQNFRPGVLEKMGLGFEELKQVRPNIILVSVSGFGTHGPYADQRTYDTVIQGVSGLAVAQTNYDTGLPGLIQTSIVDKLTSLNVFQAITAALLARERTGKGQHVQINMLRATLAFMWPDLMANSTWLGDDVVLGGSGANARLVFRTKDHFIVVLALSNDEWSGLCTALGKTHLIDDPRFKEIGDRILHFADQYEELKDAFLSKTTAEWLPVLKEVDAVYAPVNAPENVHLDPQVIASHLIVEDEHPHSGAYRRAEHAVEFGETPARFRRHAPLLGEHTEEILLESGYSPADIESLKTSGAI